MPRLDRIRTWIFDLDNTLYPPDSPIFPQVHQRMAGFIMERLGLSEDAAVELRGTLYRRYGQSLRGLMLEHGIDPEAYLAHVHDIDLSSLQPNPDLAAALAALPGRRLIYTNGSTPHAERVLERLGLTPLFAGIHDIVAANYDPKPGDGAFEAFLAAHGVAPESAAFFEDSPINLRPAHERGMATILVSPARPDALPDYVQHHTADLCGFLQVQA